MLQRCHFVLGCNTGCMDTKSMYSITRNIHSTGGQKKKSVPVPSRRKEVLRTLSLPFPDGNCRLDPSDNLWLLPSRSSSGPSLKSLQTGSSLLRRDPGKASGRENKHNRKFAVSSKQKNWSVLVLCSCVGVWGLVKLLDERRCSPWGDMNRGVVTTAGFLWYFLQISVQRSDLHPGWGEVKWRSEQKPKRPSLSISKRLLQNSKCVPIKGREDYWGVWSKGIQHWPQKTHLQESPWAHSFSAISSWQGDKLDN